MATRTDSLLKLVLVICAGVMGTIFNGIVLSVLWFWFAVPLGVAPIETAHAVGIAVLVSLLTKQYTPSSKERGSADTSVFPAVAVMLVIPWFYLLVGWFAYMATQ